MQYYFQYKDSELCYQRAYFIELMKIEGIKSIEVYKAEKVKESGFGFCRHHEIIVEDGDCGKCCNSYAPRNGKSGCCKYFSTAMYEPGEKVTLKIK